MTNEVRDHAVRSSHKVFLGLLALIAVIVIVAMAVGKSSPSFTPVERAYLQDVRATADNAGSDTSVVRFGHEVCTIYGDGQDPDVHAQESISAGVADGVSNIGLVAGAAVKDLCPQYTGKT